MTLDHGHNDTPIGHEQPCWEVYVSDIFCIRKLLNWHISGAVRHDNTSFVPPPPSRKHFLAVGTTVKHTDLQTDAFLHWTDAGWADLQWTAILSLLILLQSPHLHLLWPLVTVRWTLVRVGVVVRVVFFCQESLMFGQLLTCFYKSFANTNNLISFSIYHFLNENED